MIIEITYTNNETETKRVTLFERDKNGVMWFLVGCKWEHSFCVRLVRYISA